MAALRHTQVAIISLLAFPLSGCFDRDCAVEVTSVRSASGGRGRPPEHDLTWEFRIRDSHNGLVSCRPGNLYSDLGLNYWTTLYAVGRHDDSKVLSGLRGGKEVTLVIKENGMAWLLEEQEGDTVVHEFTYSSKPSLKKDGAGNLIRVSTPIGTSFYFAKVFTEN